MSGPLAAYRDGFAEELAGQGHTSGSAERQVGLMAHLSRWLESRSFGAGDLTADRVREFLTARRADGRTRELPERGMAPLLGYLRGLGVVPVPTEPVACTAAELLVEDYRRYLVSEQGLAESTVCAYLGTARLFLCQRAAQPGGLALDDLDWRRGEIRVRGKGGRTGRLPLPADAGEAMAGYLQHGRPRSRRRLGPPDPPH